MTEQPLPWSTHDATDFNPADTDRAKIERHIWVPCRICWSLYERLRLTALYCHDCEQGFCEGEHGRFDEKRNHFRCVLHHSRTPLISN